MKSFSLSLLTAALIPAVATAQFSSDIGAPLGVSDDSVADVVAGFAVTFPDGSTTTDLRVDSNGRITRTSDADGSDFSESVLGGTFDIGLLDIPTIAPMWDDLSPQEGDDVWFFTDGTRCNITWIDAEDFTFDGSYTFQCQLFDDGRIVFCYDGRADAASGDGLVGLGDGTAMDPTGSDLSTAAGSMTGFASVYETFSGANAFDLQDLCIEFTPAAGEYTIATSAAGMAPVAPFMSDGVCTDTGFATNRAFEFTPDGMGGYTVAHVPGTFVDDSATSTDLTTTTLVSGSADDGLYMATLGFPFDMPGGVSVTDIFVDTNARILADSSDSSDFSASVGEMLTGSPASICPFWCDMTPGVLTFSTTATEAYVTMVDGTQFGESDQINWQVTLRSDNSFQINLTNTSRWNTGSGFSSDDVLVGCSSGTSGAGTDPGSSNLAESTNTSNGEGTFYEFWDASPTPGDTPTGQAVLDCDGTPALGGSIDVRAAGLTVGRAATTLFFGFSNPGDLPLDLIGIEGGTLSAGDFVTIGLSDAGDEASFGVALPGDPGFVGLLNLDLQVIYISFGETSLGAVLTNGINVAF